MSASRDITSAGRRIRYCARPPFALERIAQAPEANGEQQIVYRLPKPLREGRTQPTLTPLELTDHLAALSPPPRLHRHRYHDVLAPNAPLRAAAAALRARCPAHYPWAALIVRLFLTLPLVCPRCGADMRIIAFITETAPVRRILTHIGEPTELPRISPARGPPAWDDPPVEAVPDWEVLA